MLFGIKTTYIFRSLADFTVFNCKDRCSHLLKYVRRAFLFSSRKGSLTLEAAIALPLYMFFLIAILYILNILHIQNVFQAAMEEASRKINSYAYVAEQFEELKEEERAAVGSQDPGFVLNLAKHQISKITIRNSFFTEQIKNIADSSYIKNGSKGIIISLGGNDLSEYIDFNISYMVQLPFLPSGIFYIPITQRCYFKPFVGTDITEKKGGYCEYVYITATGSVYHTTPYCTYLNRYYDVITDEQLNVTWDTAEGYHACPHCAYNQPIGPASFLCPGRNVYHNRTDCIYIETFVYKIPKDKTGIMPMCSRCKKGVK